MPGESSDEDNRMLSPDEQTDNELEALSPNKSSTLRERLNAKRLALLERKQTAGSGEPSPQQQNARGAGAGGFAGVSLAAKRERLRQQREERQAEADHAKSKLLRRRGRGRGDKSSSSNNAGAESENSSYSSGGGSSGSGSEGATEYATSPTAAGDRGGSPAGRRRRRRTGRRAEGESDAARIARFDLEDTLLLGANAASNSRGIVLLKPQRPFHAVTTAPADGSSSALWGTLCGDRCGGCVSGEHLQQLFGGHALEDPGETAKVLLIPGSDASSEGVRELRRAAAEWRQEEALLQQQRVQDGLAVETEQSAVTRLRTAGHLRERLLRERLINQVEKEERHEWLKLHGLEVDSDTDDAAEDPEATGTRDPPLAAPNEGKASYYDDINGESLLWGTSHNDTGEPSAELAVAMPRIALHDHPLFCAEDRLYARARQVYGKYKAHLAADESRYLRRRLHADVSAALTLRHSLETVDEADVEGDADATLMESREARMDELLWLRDDLLSTAAALVEAETTAHELTRTLYSLWRDIQDCREESRYTSTPAKLQALELAVLPPASGTTTAAAGQSTELTLGDQIDAIEDIDEWLESSATASETADALDDDVEGDVEAVRKTSAQRQQRLHRLLSACRAVLLPPTSSSGGYGGDSYSSKWKNVTRQRYVLKLSADAAVTPDEDVPPLERLRRAKARGITLQAALYINSVRVCTTASVRVTWPRYCATFDHVAHLRLVRRPASAQVKVYRKRPLWSDEEVASVWVPVPGAGAQGAPPVHSLTSRVQWCQFASERVSFADEHLPGSKAVRTTGAVLVGMEWTSRDADVALLPETVAPTAADQSPLNQVVDLVCALWSAQHRKRLRVTPKLGPRPHDENVAAAHNVRGSSSKSGSSSAAMAYDPNDPCQDGGIRSYGADVRDTSDSTEPFQESPAYLMSFWGQIEAASRYSRISAFARLGATTTAAAATVGNRRSSTIATAATAKSYSYLNSTKWKEPMRHTLLRIRRKKPHLLGNRAIPLTEAECRADEALEAILATAEAEEAAVASLMNDGDAHSSDDEHEQYRDHGSSKAFSDSATAAATYNVDALLEESKDERLGVDPRRLAQFIRLLQSGSNGRRGSSSNNPHATNDTYADGTNNGVGDSPLEGHSGGYPSENRDGTLGRVPFTSVVREMNSPVVAWNYGLINILPPRVRALKPPAKAYLPVAVQVDSCRLLVQVVSARNVPARLQPVVGGRMNSPGVSPSRHVNATSLSPTRRSSLGGTARTYRRSDVVGETGDFDPEEEEDGYTSNAHNARNGSSNRNTAGSSNNNNSSSAVDRDEPVLASSGACPVNSFAEVRFQGGTRRTQTYEGKTPLWKETVDLPFIPPGGDFNPGTLSQINDAVHVSLFDQIEYDDIEQGGFIEGESTVRTEKRYLGSLAIPFQTIYAAGRLDGYLRLKTPPINLGYESALSNVIASSGAATTASGNNAPSGTAPAAGSPVRRNPRQPGASSTGNRRTSDETEGTLMASHEDPASSAYLLRHSEECTYVRVLVMLDPLLARPGTGDDSSGSGSGRTGVNQANGDGLRRDDTLVSYAARWKQRIQQMPTDSSQPRQVEVFVPHVGGGESLICRYLTPQQPPHGLDTVQKCVHFVRLLPFLEDWQSSNGCTAGLSSTNVQDVWCTSQQFLDVLAGDWEEHAILLHNYILWLVNAKAARQTKRGNSNINSSTLNATAMAHASGANKSRGNKTVVLLVLGKGVPEGNTVYVMVKEVDKFGDTLSVVVWNACTGEGYDVRDTRCPLLEVGCVASSENVWGNIQRSCRPCDLNWDTSQASLWRPFFAPPHNPLPEPPLLHIQPNLHYRPTDSAFVYKVEDLLRETIKREVRKWRSRRGPTSFNADVSNRLAEVLPMLEQQERGEMLVNSDVGLNSLEGVTRQRDAVGFPLHSGFTTAADVALRVRATGVHESRHPEVQFALAVQCFPYCNNVLSVWVYMASITPKT